MPRERIPSYSLFGESTHLPDVLHCETIAARSVLHDWEFEPHRHARLHQMLLLERGGGAVHLESGDRALAPMTLVNVPAGAIHGFSFEPGTQGWVATLADELRDELLARSPHERRALERASVQRADREMLVTMRQIHAEFEGRSAGRALLLRGLCTALIARAARGAGVGDAPRIGLPESDLVRRFEALLETHWPEHWKVADYARALAVTPTHLSRVMRRTSGAPASAQIDARVMREARRNLAYTSLPVSTIAYSLGFHDPAYFTRVFTRSVGTSPRGFRERLAL